MVVEVSMLIFVVGVMYMFIFSFLEIVVIWIIFDVRVIIKIKLVSKESIDSKER